MSPLESHLIFWPFLIITTAAVSGFVIVAMVAIERLGRWIKAIRRIDELEEGGRMKAEG